MTSIRSIIPGIVLLAGAMMLNAAFAQEAKNPVLARLGNGETITEKDLTQYVGRRIDLKAVARNASGVTTVVQEMALARALALEGQSLGVPPRSEKGDTRFDDIYAHTIFSKISPACEAPKDEAAVRDFYDKNPKAFTLPTAIRLSRVILPAAEKVDGEPAGTWLMNQVQVIGAGRQKFEDAARRAEQAYKLDAQGDLGWVMLNEENLILRALGDANQGDIVGPVKDGDFVYLFQVAEKRPSQVVPWTEVSAVAAKRAVSYCREQARIDVQQRMFQKYGVQLDENAVRSLFEAK
ncbi:peptidyl-prolyl cis-trans isomerase [Alicycliphilus denitrificans]|uniref:Peptidyl-prolyl cis-trans isomerase n=1 Tax=Alicycliphilus denitrificans TaxID=179636 RepID=A0A3R7EHJ5_9BURK|nr:peptidylprolyl isomerase [Alicycliphilus denitrificans]RKJ99821.1 peptidyl-prolyl cis-trans isomerase [Alicycliphilus denitrificans]